MLGPVDLRDWDFEEVDAVRAGIRRLPIVRQHIEEPELAGKFLGKVLDVKLRAFNCGADFTLADLLRLYDGLQRVRMYR